MKTHLDPNVWQRVLTDFRRSHFNWLCSASDDFNAMWRNAESYEWLVNKAEEFIPHIKCLGEFRVGSTLLFGSSQKLLDEPLKIYTRKQRVARKAFIRWLIADLQRNSPTQDD